MNFAELFRHQEDLQELQAGQTLFHEGDNGNFMYVLIDGEVDIFVHGHLVEHAHAGAILGEMAMIDDSCRSATVVATIDCKLLPIDHSRFNFLVQQTPNFAINVMRVMAERLRNSDRLL